MDTIKGHLIYSIIPCDVDQFYYVTRIILYVNKIKILPLELFSTKLVTLDVSFNYLEQLPKEISNIVTLRNLDIQSNKIKYLPNEIKQLTKLETFGINSKYFPNINIPHIQDQEKIMYIAQHYLGRFI